MLRLIFILLSIKFIRTADNGSIDNDFKSKFCECKNFISPILNDSIANEQDLKFIATIQYLVPNNESESNQEYIYLNICSGLILNSFYILTTAHCLDFIRNTNNITNFRIGAGSHNLETIFNVEDNNRMIEYYSYISNENKINSTKFSLGLIRLDKPFKLEDNISAACFRNFEQDDLNDLDLYSVGYPKFFTRNGNDTIENIESQQNRTKLFLNIYANQISDPAIQFPEFDDYLPVSSNLRINIFRKGENKYPCDGKSIICASSLNPSQCLGDEGSPLLYVHNNNLYVIGLLTDIIFKSLDECIINKNKLFIAAYPYLNQDNLISSEICLNDNLINFQSNTPITKNTDATKITTKLSPLESTTEIETITEIETTTKLRPIETTTEIETTTKLPPIESTTKIDTKSTNFTTKLIKDSITTNTITNRTTLEPRTKLTTISSTKLTDKTIEFEPTTKTTHRTTRSTFKFTTRIQTTPETTTTKNASMTTTDLPTSTFKSDSKNLKLNGIKKYLVFGSIASTILLSILIIWCCCCKSKDSPLDDNKSLVNVTSFDTKSRSDHKLAKKNSITDKASLMCLKSINGRSKSDSKLKKKSSISDKRKSARKSKSSVLKSESSKSIGVKSLNSKSISLTSPSVQSAGALKSVVSMTGNIKSKKT